MWNKSSFQNEKNGIGLSPGWISVFEKSIDLRRRRGGVPVFKRPSSSPISLSDEESPSRRRRPHDLRIAGLNQYASSRAKKFSRDDYGFCDILHIQCSFDSEGRSVIV